MMYITIDIGNSFSKIGVFNDNQLSYNERVETNNLHLALKNFLIQIDKNTAIKVGFISVAQEVELQSFDIWQKFPHLQFIKIDNTFEYPIQNQYATPQTLGTDRIVAVIGARQLASNHNLLVIDAGTAITYDAASVEKGYLGGGISPGIRMRFRALHEFTARLPLIEMQLHCELIGNSTQNSMMSGVVNGTIAEIKGMIAAYRQVLGRDLRLFLTGGDATFIAEKLAENITVDNFLVLRGIYQLIVHKSKMGYVDSSE